MERKWEKAHKRNVDVPTKISENQGAIPKEDNYYVEFPSDEEGEEGPRQHLQHSSKVQLIKGFSVALSLKRDRELNEGEASREIQEDCPTPKKIKSMDATPNFIHTVCKFKIEQKTFRFSFIYGNPTFAERRFLWAKLARLQPADSSPWCCLGDFNELRFQFEKEGLRPHLESRMELFRNWINNCQLIELDLKGCKYTWMSNPRNGKVTKEKLDQVLVNWSWRQQFPNALVRVPPTESSDHSPLILYPVPQQFSGRQFKFEALWEDHPLCADVVEQGWKDIAKGNNPWSDFLNRANSCRSSLQSWHREKFRKADEEIADLKRKLQQLQDEPGAGDNWAEMNAIKGKIRELRKREEIYWAQRSRIKWLNWGDRNTRFFHSSTIQRRDRNRLVRLRNEEGDWIEGQQ
ncbi:Endonuclease/exonuclease/phosphatase superfamily, partial [Sesbania bispinosa]